MSSHTEEWVCAHAHLHLALSLSLSFYLYIYIYIYKRVRAMHCLLFFLGKETLQPTGDGSSGPSIFTDPGAPTCTTAIAVKRSKIRLPLDMRRIAECCIAAEYNYSLSQTIKWSDWHLHRHGRQCLRILVSQSARIHEPDKCWRTRRMDDPTGKNTTAQLKYVLETSHGMQLSVN